MGNVGARVNVNLLVIIYWELGLSLHNPNLIGKVPNKQIPIPCAEMIAVI